MKRSKKRYLLLQIDADVVPSQREFLEAVWGSITKTFGENGASLTNLSLIDYDEEGKSVIVRVSLHALQLVRVSLALITRIAQVDAAVHVVRISGTIKSLKQRKRQ